MTLTALAFAAGAALLQQQAQLPGSPGCCFCRYASASWRSAGEAPPCLLWPAGCCGLRHVRTGEWRTGSRPNSNSTSNPLHGSCRRRSSCRGTAAACTRTSRRPCPRRHGSSRRALALHGAAAPAARHRQSTRPGSPAWTSWFSANDHLGGALTVLQSLQADALTSSLPLGHTLNALAAARRRCLAAGSWEWDGVCFEFVDPTSPEKTTQRNNQSCVLRVASSGGSMLLSGDIERSSERQIHSSKQVSCHGCAPGASAWQPDILAR
jgi:hypothetical protein